MRTPIHQEYAKTVTAEFKTGVALEMMQGERWSRSWPRQELHASLITQWRRQAVEKAKVFDEKGLKCILNPLRVGPP